MLLLRKSLIWAMVLLILIVYIFGILFLQAMQDQVEVEMSPEALEKAEKHFGSLWLSMLSLFMSIAGGVSWGELLLPLKAVSWVWVALFLFYISWLDVMKWLQV